MSNTMMLSVLGFLGIASIYLSMKNEENIRENYGGGDAGGMPSRLVNFKQTMVAPTKNVKEFQDGQSNNIQFQDVPRGQHAGLLGSAPVTKQPFVSFPNYSQSVPKPKPSLGLPAAIKYKPPTLSQMGVTEAYQCGTNTHPGVLKEGYTGDQMIERSSNPNPKTGCNAFAAGNYNDVLAQFANPMPDSSFVGEVSMMNQEGNPENFMVFERLMTTGNARANRASRSNGQVDFIRGDLGVCYDTSHPGWFNVASNPATDLSTGAMNALVGPSEASVRLETFMKSNGGLLNDVAGGYTIPSNQQFMPQTMESFGSGINGNTILTSFT